MTTCKQHKVVGLMLFLLAWLIPANAFAATIEGNGSGLYAIDASLSCYVNAMGGIEFGKPLLADSMVTMDSNGNAKLTLYLTKSSVTIYGVTCDTFVDPSPNSSTGRGGIKDGTIGYYDSDGILQTTDIEMTVSSDTALNPESKAVHYVSSITFPIAEKTDSYHLSMYINSNVMGVQFTNAGGDSSESAYPAVLSVDWNSMSAGGDAGRIEQDASEPPVSSLPTEDNANDSLPTGEGAEDAHAQASPDRIENTEVVSEDGLNIYYADSPETEEESAPAIPSTERASPYIVTSNNKILAVAAVVGFVILLAGIGLMLVSRKTKKTTPASSAEMEK